MLCCNFAEAIRILHIRNDMHTAQLIAKNIGKADY